MNDKSDYLVLGATGSIGAAFIGALLRKNRPATILVRSKAKAQNLFGETPLLEIVEGDALDKELVTKLAEGKKYIFHGINFPYNKWENNMEAVTRNIIEAATSQKALILFPGNIYNFGTTTPIFEDTRPNPITRKGKIRVKLENILQSAAEAGNCRVLIVRFPDFFGPNVTNGLMTPIFKNALQGKTIKWLIRTDIPHQLVYIQDAGDLFLRLSERSDLADFEVVNFGGMVVNSVQDWLKSIARTAGAKATAAAIPKIALTLLGPFVPIIREVKEMSYLFENNIELNDDKLKIIMPDFKPTPMESANRQTLRWFRLNVIK